MRLDELKWEKAIGDTAISRHWVVATVRRHTIYKCVKTVGAGDVRKEGDYLFDHDIRSYNALEAQCILLELLREVNECDSTN